MGNLVADVVNVIRLIFWAIITGGQITMQAGWNGARTVRQTALAYMMIMVAFASITVGTISMIIVPGILMRWASLIAFGFLCCLGATTILSATASPIAAVVHFLVNEAGWTRQGARITGKSIVRAVSGILVGEQTVTLIAMLLSQRDLQYSDYLYVLLFFVISGMGLWLASIHWGVGGSWWERVVVGINLATIFGLLAFVAIPKVMRALVDARDPIDTSVAQMITCASVEAEEAKKLGCPSPTPQPPSLASSASTPAETTETCAVISPTKENPDTRVEVKPGCWYFVRLPAVDGLRWSWDIIPDQDAEFAQSSGKVTRIKKGDWLPTGISREQQFRVRAMESAGTLTVSVRFPS